MNEDLEELRHNERSVAAVYADFLVVQEENDFAQAEVRQLQSRVLQLENDIDLSQEVIKNATRMLEISMEELEELQSSETTSAEQHRRVQLQITETSALVKQLDDSLTKESGNLLLTRLALDSTRTHLQKLEYAGHILVSEGLEFKVLQFEDLIDVRKI
jgi:hypothetical protein